MSVSASTIELPSNSISHNDEKVGLESALGLEKTVGTETSSQTDLESAPVPPPINPYGDHVFKDGGLKAWLTVFGAWMIYFSTFGIVTSFGVFQAYYVQHSMRGRSPSDIAWIGSLQLCLLFLPGLVVGKLFDDGYFHHLMIVGSVLEVFGLFMLSISKTYVQVFLSQGVCVGIGMSLIFVPGLAVLQHHFLKKRALVNGIAATGSSIGGILFATMLNQTFKPGSHVGFNNGVRITACLVAVALLVANLVMRTDVPPRKERKVQIPIPNPVDFFKEPRFNLVLAGEAIAFTGLFFPMFYLQLDAELHGVDSNLAFYLLTVYNVTSIPGRLLPNYLADKLGIYNIMITCMLACSAIILGMLGIKMNDARTAVVAIAAFYGFFSGAVISLLTPLAMTVSRNPFEYGIRGGVMFLFIGPCGLLSGPIAGWLLGDRSKPFSWSWEKPVAFSVTVLTFSAFLLLAARMLLAREKGSSKI